MTRNEILDIAREFYTNGGVCEREIAFARFVMAKEREECANLAEADGHKELAEKIRNRIPAQRQ